MKQLFRKIWQFIWLKKKLHRSEPEDVRTKTILGSLSKSLRLALIRLPEVNFPKNVTLRMCVGCIQP